MVCLFLLQVKIQKLKPCSGDHIFGLIPLLAGCLNGAGGTADGIEDPRKEVNVNDPVRYAPSALSNLNAQFISLSRFMVLLALGHISEVR